MADFGLLNDCDLVGSTTMRAGTPGFQAPEQLQGKSISSKCDVYSLGGVITELFGEVPLWRIKYISAPNQVPCCCSGYVPVHRPPPRKDSRVDKTASLSAARADVTDVLTKVLDLLNDIKSWIRTCTAQCNYDYLSGSGI